MELPPPLCLMQSEDKAKKVEENKIKGQEATEISVALPEP